MRPHARDTTKSQFLPRNHTGPPLGGEGAITECKIMMAVFAFPVPSLIEPSTSCKIILFKYFEPWIESAFHILHTTTKNSN